MSSDLRPEAQEVVDDVKAIIAPFKERIEALEGEVKSLSLSLLTAQGQAWDNHERAERLRVAITTAIANMDHDYAYEVLCKAVAEECLVSPVKYTGGMNDLCVSAMGDDVRSSELLRKALASVDRHMTDAVICLAAGGTKGSATNILNRAVDIARKALQDNKQ